MQLRTIAAIALGAATVAGSGPVTGHPAEAARTVLVVVAHPDDELFVAPAIASEVRAGSQVHILFATSGDAGPGVSAFEPGEALAQARRAEAACSAQALGSGWEFLEGFGDGTLTQTPHGAGSPAKRLVQQIGASVAARTPDIVITWGPDGGYGHGDHRMVSAAVTQVLQAMPAEDRPVLLYPALVSRPLPEPLRQQGWASTASDLASVRVGYSDADLTAANSAAQCHVTQFDEASRAGLMPLLHQAVWHGEVAFREAF